MILSHSVPSLFQLRGPYCAGVDVDLLMEPTRDFPGIISPKVIQTDRGHKILPLVLYDNMHAVTNT